MTEVSDFKEVGIQRPGENGEFRYAAIKGSNLWDNDEHGVSLLLHGFEIQLSVDTVESIVEIVNNLHDLIDQELVDYHGTKLVMGKGIGMEPMTCHQAADFNEDSEYESTLSDAPDPDYDKNYSRAGHVSLLDAKVHISPDRVEFVTECKHSDLAFRTSEVSVADLRAHLEMVCEPDAPTM